MKSAQQGIDNSPPPRALSNLYRVAATLEQVRALVDVPIDVSSGYRCLVLNRAVGSDDTSAHLKGLAVDFTAAGLTPHQLAQRIRDSSIVFDQLIYEGTWVHLGLSEGPPRRECRTRVVSGGRVSYPMGIK